MQTHELRPKHKSKYRKIVGRGGKKGTYSGRGGKGQTARSGRKVAPIIRELIKRYPKLKGYRAFVIPTDTVVVNLNVLDKNFKDSEVVNSQTLTQKGIAKMIKGKQPNIKILGKGTLSKKLVFENCKISATAKIAIEKAGGVIK